MSGMKLFMSFLHCVKAGRYNQQYACTSARTRSLPFCNSSLSVASRVKDLLKQLTTDEKLSLMAAHGNDICAFDDGGVPRLDIPSYTWCTEINTGVSTACLAEGKCVTTFPSPAVFGSAFNRTLWSAKGAVQADEFRAYFNSGGVRGKHGRYIGLNGWGPNINVVRDPRYGRNSELPSEDPYLNGEYAVHVVRSTQEGDDPAYPLKIQQVSLPCQPPAFMYSLHKLTIPFENLTSLVGNTVPI